MLLMKTTVEQRNLSFKILLENFCAANLTKEANFLLLLSQILLLI